MVYPYVEAASIASASGAIEAVVRWIRPFVCPSWSSAVRSPKMCTDSHDSAVCTLTIKLLSIAREEPSANSLSHFDRNEVATAAAPPSSASAALLDKEDKEEEEEEEEEG